jgi:site-specific recombinase XerD
MTDQTEDLTEHLQLWLVALRAQRKSEATQRTYRDCVSGYLRWLDDTGRPQEITLDLVRGYLAHMAANGASSTTRLRHAALRQFSKWMANEVPPIIPSDPLLKLPPPKVDSKVVPTLTEEELRALLAACKGRDFRDIRDTAIVRLMAESGLRAGECVGLQVGDVDINRGLVTVRRGKGGKGRIVAVGPSTAVALGRWLRMRRTHRLADTPALWLGAGGKGFAYHGLEGAMKYRAGRAGLKHFHLHMLRHTFATRWLGAGGSEQALMSLAGWSNRAMLDHYTKASAGERAVEEAQRLGLGEL